ncbi:hypothetical protein TRVL_01032 [Trypanosoma vivax]|nr:hypothetical protein TRVL_01032 [Trypanosoma vivax]
MDEILSLQMYGRQPLPGQDGQGRWSCDPTSLSPQRDFDCVLAPSCIAHANTGRRSQSAAIGSPLRERPLAGVASLVQSLQVPGMDCRMCAQISSVRESLRNVEESYLREIEQLQQLVSQFEVERRNALKQVEASHAAFGRSREMNMVKDREIQALGGQVRQLEERLQRAEYEMSSVRRINSNDVAFYHQKEMMLFGESESNAREAVTSAEAAWWCVLMEKWANTTSAAGKGSVSPVDGFRSGSPLPCSGRNARSSSRGSVSRDRSLQRCPSITRESYACREGDEPLDMHTIGGGRFVEQHQPTKRSDELHLKMRRELESKNKLIDNLKQQLSEKEKMLKQCSQNSFDETLVVEMQEEIDDMLLNELQLTQSCQRSVLEAEAAEERVQALQWLLQKHTTSGLERRHATPQRVLTFTSPHPVTPETLPRHVDLHSLGSQRGRGLSVLHGELQGIIKDAVMETLKDGLQSHLLPLKLSVDSLRAHSEELVGRVREGMEMAKSSATTPLIDALDTLKREQAVFMDDVKRLFSEFGAGSATTATAAAQELSQLRQTFVKMARLTTRNDKIMDDKLNDILLCQSAAARQVVLATMPPVGNPRSANSSHANSSHIASPSKLSTIGTSANLSFSSADDQRTPSLNNSRQVRFADEKLMKDKVSNARVESTSPVCRDVARATDSRRTTMLAPAESAKRRTPYDVDDI